MCVRECVCLYHFSVAGGIELCICEIMSAVTHMTILVISFSFSTNKHVFFILYTSAWVCDQGTWCDTHHAHCVPCTPKPPPNARALPRKRWLPHEAFFLTILNLYMQGQTCRARIDTPRDNTPVAHKHAAHRHLPHHQRRVCLALGQLHELHVVCHEYRFSQISLSRNRGSPKWYSPHAEPVACKGQEKDEFAKMPLLFV